MLHEFKALYQQMKQAGRLRIQFDYQHPNNKAQFVVVFLADSEPFKLMLAAKGVNHFVLVLDMLRGFKVIPWLNLPEFKLLMDALGVTGPGRTGFKLTSFLRELAAAAPKSIQGVQDAKPSVLVRHHSDVEEADKIYFWYFVIHTGGKHARKENLDKTRLLLGEECFQLCREKNISSCWSADSSKEKPYRPSLAAFREED